SLATLGEGGNGTAYLVKWHDELAVLKVSHFSEDERLMRESQYMVLLEGAGGVPMLLAYSEEPPAILMTYCGQYTLQDIIKGKGPDGYDLLQLGLMVGQRLLEIHRKGLIHNDLKPNNVVVSGDPQSPRVNIIDLGLACFQEVTNDLESDPEDYPWMAPEVKRGQPSTRKSDVFSYAVLLIRILQIVYKRRRLRV
ncbi:uncharacterized protein, partial [Panulirus ornatus]|uniref:uncharacterized protein n=1 Tax=Panulirus ornatus TaxID=150431 RepID=UPI003A863D6E